MDADTGDRKYKRGAKMNETGIKIPRLDGNDAEVRQELRVFARQVAENIEYLRTLFEELLEAVGKE